MSTKIELTDNDKEFIKQMVEKIIVELRNLVGKIDKLGK